MMHSPFRHIGSVFSKSRPIHLTFFITRRCNSVCPFCFYLKKENANLSGDNELSLAEIEKISSSFGSLLWLAFSGGEIFLRDDLVEISRTFYKNNKPAIMLYPTNGLLPETIRQRMEQILKDCGKSTIAVKLSIDGLHESHDRLRNTPESFSKTIETYNLLRGLLDIYPNFELGVNTVFCSDNQDKMDDIINFITSMPAIKTHTISLVRGNLKDKRFQEIDNIKYQTAIKRLELNMKKKETSKKYRFTGNRIKAAQDILQRNLISKTLEKKERQIPCYAGKLSLVLTEQGEVYPCEILTESFGNVREYEWDINNVLKSDKAKSIIKSIDSEQCYCTHECNYITNILFNPKLYPALLEKYISIK